MHPLSVPGVLDVKVVRGLGAVADAPIDLLIEIPHGATTTQDYEAIAAQLESPLPAGLIDFFRVNTDIGAPELAFAFADRVVELDPTLTVMILRARVPRTFLDFNRRIDASAAEFKAGGVGPGLMPWVITGADKALLFSLYGTWVRAVEAACDHLAADGLMLLLHTYAPRTVGVSVDADIVPSLHAAYEPDIFETWPLRPELDLIARGEDGERVIPDALFEAITRRFAPLGIAPGDSATYRLHPATLGHRWVQRFPGRVLCPEFRRDLLTDAFEPFSPANISDEKVAPLAGALAAAVVDFRGSR